MQYIFEKIQFSLQKIKQEWTCNLAVQDFRTCYTLEVIFEKEDEEENRLDIYITGIINNFLPDV